MKKRMLAVLPLLFVLMVAMGGSVTAPTAAAPMTPSCAPYVPSMSELPMQDPGFGGCRWYCGSRSYTTRSQCQANCSTQCEDIC